MIGNPTHYTVVDDKSTHAGCVTVEGPGGHRFSVASSQIEQIAAPAGMTYNQSMRQFVPLGA